MNRYIFGLSNYKTKQWVEEQWLKYGEKKLDKFIEQVLNKEGDHILPLLSGDEEVISLIRKRYFDNLTQVLTEKELKEALKLEMTVIVKTMQS